jgi:hypothetical protein
MARKARYPAATLCTVDLDLLSRKGEYLRAVAEAALDGLLDGAALRALDPGQAVQRVQQVKGLGSFAAELVVVRGANAPTPCPATNAGSAPRSPSGTAPATPSPKSRKDGGPTAPGPPFTSARCASSAPARSPAAEPPGHAQWPRCDRCALRFEADACARR